MPARLLRAPGLHFLLIGGLLFALVRAREEPPRPSIVLTAADVARLRDEWKQAHGAEPPAAVEAGLVERAVDEEILHREALALGLDRRDVAVRERLVRLGRFLDEDASPAGDDAVEQEARRLGLERGDVVVRRHLVEMVRLGAARLGRDDLPTEAELEAWLEHHGERFAQPARIDLVQVYLGRARHGPALERDAETELAGLRRSGAGPEAAATRGDPFIRGADPGLASRAELERIFGHELAQLADDAPLATWVGPVRSPYGLHLVWIRARVPGGLPPLATVRTQVLHGLLAERSAARLESRLRALRARYDVRVERGGA